MAQPVPSVDERIATIAERLGKRDEDFRKNRVPGLKSLLDDYINPDVDVDKIDFHRRLLQVFKNSQDQTYEQILAHHTLDEQKSIEDFVGGADLETVGKDFVLGPSLGCRQELERLHSAQSIFKISSAGLKHVKGLNQTELKSTNEQWFSRAVHKLSALFIDLTEDHDLLVYKHAEFQNWGLTVENTPQFTCVPSTAKAIQRIVKFAAANNYSVRCSGYRHSWAPIYGRSGQILISTIQLSTASKLPNIAALPLPECSPTELETIEIVQGTPKKAGNTLVRVGCATTNERLRRWCVENNRVTIPLNTILVEVTLGGSTAAICHGAGIRHPTLSDLVRAVEYVDCHGTLQLVTDAEHLRAASGSFGLMGVITHITMEFPPMTYALFNPLKIPVVQAVPPPPHLSDAQIPPALLKGVDRSPEQRAKDQADFERRVKNDYYAEWFWFPFSDNAWVNTWNDTSDPTGVVDFPNTNQLCWSFIQTVTMNILQSTPLLDELIKVVHMTEAAVTMISRAAMYALPDKPVKTYLPDALHFQRCVQNVRVRDMELEVPMVARRGTKDQIDFALVQRAWWDALLTVYEPKHVKNCPQRMPLEMRITGGSDVVLAPQRHNRLGTFSIEVLTLRNASDIWDGFAQEILDKWMALKDPNTGEPLNSRPHWAKEWVQFKVAGKPWADRLRNQNYKKEIAEFKEILADIGAKQGWTLEDLKTRFSNDFFDDMIFYDVGLPPKAAAAPETGKSFAVGVEEVQSSVASA